MARFEEPYVGVREEPGGRFRVVFPSEYDAAEDDLSVVYYRVQDKQDGANTTVAYTKTLADAVFVMRLMNKGAE